MIDNKNGFTLLELLIAAALISVLAMFATQAFRASASDVRIADAQARASLLVNAAQRYYIEYPNATAFAVGDTNVLQAFAQPGTCLTHGSYSDSPQQLVNCGFLEYRQIAYDSKRTNNDKVEFSASVNMWFASVSPETAAVEVCFQGKGRVTDRCTYCTTNGNDFSKACSE